MGLEDKSESHFNRSIVNIILHCFHHCRRIAFCLDVHNEAVKSMRYPPDEVYRKELQRQAGGDKKKEDEGKDEKTIEELIKEMEDDMDE